MSVVVKPNPLGFIHITESAAERTRSQEESYTLLYLCFINDIAYVRWKVDM